MLDDIATNEVKTVNTAAGLPINDPAEREAMESLAKYKQSAGYIGKSALTGAAMGIQAGQGAMNPMTALIQGYAAGIQAPALVMEQRQKQVMSTLDAMPFGNRFPELGKQYPLLAGMPSSLALETMKGIAQDTARIVEENRQQRITNEMKAKSPVKDYKNERDMALDFQKIPEVSEYKQIKSNYNTATTTPLFIKEQKTGKLVPNGAGQLAVITAYIRSINPQARFTEGTISAADVGSTIDKNTIDLYNKVFNGSVAGTDEIKKMQSVVRTKYREVLKRYRPVADIWADSSEAQGLDSNFVLSGDTGSGESRDDVYNTIAAQNPGMSENEIFAIMVAQGY